MSDAIEAKLVDTESCLAALTFVKRSAATAMTADVDDKATDDDETGCVGSVTTAITSWFRGPGGFSGSLCFAANVSAKEVVPVLEATNGG